MTETLSVTQAERDKAKAAGNSLPDGSYPINNTHQLHAAAVLAASHHGDWKAAMALIRRRAKELGVDVTTLPGFGSESKSAAHDPGFELRKRRRASMIRQAERRGLLLEVRAKPDGTGGTEFVFEGYGSVFDSPFDMWDKWGEPYTEVVKPGAFTRSLQRPDLDVPFLIGHDESRLALARTKNGTLQLSQDSRGLSVRAVMDGRRSDVRDLAYAVERGDQDEMSIGFVTMDQKWSEDYETREMRDLDLHRGDVSSVALAALPATAGASMTFPAETLSRGRRAAAVVTTDDPDSDHLMPMVGPNHPPFTGTHSHLHASGPDGSQHDHAHEHDGDNNHVAHMHGSLAAHGPRERRGNPVDQGLGDASDFEPNGGTTHVASPPKCSGARCRELSPAGAPFCSWCGDALVRLDDQGVPAMEEEQGSAATLGLKRRQLELLMLVR